VVFEGRSAKKISRLNRSAVQKRLPTPDLVGNKENRIRIKHATNWPTKVPIYQKQRNWQMPNH